MAEVATAEQIAEYETQLANIEELLAASPNDESLLALKNDLVELLHLTRASYADASASVTSSYASAADSGALELDLPPPPPLPPSSSLQAALDMTAEQAVAAGAAAAAFATEDDKPTTTTAPMEGTSEKKKVKMLKDFVVPPHLIVNENDSEADKKRKRRALKALKSQHRERRREVEHEQKQKSWQSFQKKKKVTSTTGTASSIFATQEAVNDRVGVISRKTKTEFSQRKRHKQL